MNIEPDGGHRIVPEHELILDNPADRARWLRLTEAEARELMALTPEGRHEWLRRRLSTKERLARHLEWRGLPGLAHNARRGLYSDFESSHPTPKMLLVKHLKREGAHDIVKYVVSGEYDDDKYEAERWAHSPEAQEIMRRLCDDER